MWRMRKRIERGILGATNGCGRWHPALLGLAFLLGCSVSLFASESVRPAIINGLIHYWPELWDAYDEVTGQEGVIMAVLPPAAEDGPDETPFNDETGWVQLPVRLRADQAWTLSFWMRPVQMERAGGTVVALHAREQQWGLLEIQPGPQPRYQWMARGPQFDHGPELPASFDTWQHVVISKSEDAQVTAWRDGKAQGQTQLSFPPDLEVEWIVAGNDLKGDTQFFGQLRDLALFDRMLSEPEVQAIHAAGRSDQPARQSVARRAALRSPTPVAWSTNVVQRSVESFAHRRYTAEDGLPQNRVQCLLQTREGYLWVGTEAGPARFDGSRFRAFDEDNTPALTQADLDFFSLAETDDGTVWAGTTHGLLRIRDTEFTAVTQGLPERFILLLAPASEDALWVAAFRNDRHYRGPCRVRRYHPDTGHSTAEVVVPGQVRRMVPVEEGLWLATEGPELLLFWDLKAPAPTVVARPGGSPLAAVVLDRVEPLGGVQLRGWFDPDQPSRRVLEFAVGREGHRFHWIGPDIRSKPNASRWSVPQNPDSWLGAEPGLARIVEDRLEMIDFRELPTTPEVLCLSPNREGGFWVGTAGEGLHLIRERLIEVFTSRDGLSGNDVRSVLATSEGTVLAGGPAGLDEFRDGRWTRRGMDSSWPVAAVISIAQDASGTVWVGHGHSGIDALRALAQDVPWDLSLGGLDWHHPKALASTHDGRLWVGCNRGISWVEPGGLPIDSDLVMWRSQIRHGRLRIGEHVPDAVFLKLLPDRDNSLWVGTLGRGLLRVQNQQVERFTTQDGLPADIIVPAHLDESGALWLTTKGAVVRRLRDRFEVLTQQQGIPNDYLLDIIEDDQGHYWLPGLRGIHRLVRSELEACLEGSIERVQSLSLGVRDGLLTPECTTFHYPITARTPDGRIWVATRVGVASIDPARVQVDNRPLPVAIEQVSARQHIFADPLRQAGITPLRLPAGSGERLEFHFTAVSLVAADRVRFRYWLDGYDADWSAESDLRLAYYTNLRPGTYRFRVMASNAHGLWNDEATSLALTIAPHFWQTRLFQWSAGLLVLGLAILLHRQRVGVLRHVQALRHQQQLANERARIAADMHDDLGAALSQISILSEVAKSQSSPQPRAHSALDRISQSARDVTSRMSDLVWATNPRNDTLDNLASYLREQVAMQLEPTGIRAILRFPGHLSEVHVSATFRRNMLLTVKEAVNNAIKHATPTEMLLELAVASGRLDVRLEDNGRGFDTRNVVPQGNGLSNMRRRIEDLHGTFHLESTPGHGTRIHGSVPLPGGQAALP
jgi:signal transduction histidine kinase/ligand-binding sensor domain-containing protein